MAPEWHLQASPVTGSNTETSPAICSACQADFSPHKTKSILAISKIQPPPRFLLGATLLFWGAMTGRVGIGIILALVVEGAHLTKFRWDFDQEASGKAWRLTTVIIAFAAVLIYMDGNPYIALPSLLTWMPLLLMPMQFIQSYGLNDSLAVNTFSFLAKQRRRRNLRLGLTESINHINFGNVYFAAAMVASTLGSEASSRSSLFLPGIIILTGWILLAASGSRPFALLLALSMSGVIAVAGERGLQELEDWFGNQPGRRSQFDPDSVSTMIGRPGPVNLSPDILWRLRPQANVVPPRLLRTASYNTYRTGTWTNQHVSDREFNDLSSRMFEQVPYFITTPDADEDTQLKSLSPVRPRFNLRGSAFEETPLPLPGDVGSLRDFELDGIEGNAMGTIRVFPKNSVIEGEVLWKCDTNPDVAPDQSDKFVPRHEGDALHAVLKELRLDEETLSDMRPEDRPKLQEKLTIIRLWFQQNFKYTRSLSIQSSTHVATTPTAITQFLTKIRAGHCEYFASASTLLLREAGIPTRYAVGYAVTEGDQKRQEYIVRGTHGHAWTRVWDASARKWIDFDSTPSLWLASVSPPTSFMQRMNDQLKRWREDFFLWRNRPANRLGASLVMIAIGLGLAGFIFHRLWKSKRRMESTARSNGYEGPSVRTPLHQLERLASKKIGPRPKGLPFGLWIAQLHLHLGDSSSLGEAIELHQRLRFDPTASNESHLDRLSHLTKDLEATLRRI